MNLIEVFQAFPDQKSCIDLLEQRRWNGVPKCPYCGSKNTNALLMQLRHHCNGCRKTFSVTVGTVFHHTHIPLQKWFLAIVLVINAKKGLSARQLGRDLNLNKDTAWRMAMKIREAMQDGDTLLSGIVEMDEAYVDGKPRKEAPKDDDDLGPPVRGQRPGLPGRGHAPGLE